MSMTKRQYRSNVIDLGGTYGAEMRLGNRIIDRAVQFAIDEVYRRIVAKRSWIFEKTATLADGDALPDDYVTMIDVYYTSGGHRVSFRYAPLPSLGGVKNNTSALGEADDPCYSLVDHKLITTPAGLSGISVVYNAKPTQLYNPQSQPIDTTVSNIPQDLDGLVIRGAFERVAILMAEEPDAFKMTQESIERVRQDNMQLYMEQMERLMTTKGANDVTVH